MLKLKPIVIAEKRIGHWGKHQETEIFFGTRFGELSLVEKHFQCGIQFLKQTHGDKIVSASSKMTPSVPDSALQEADAHWTELKGLAIGVYTADCLPVLISCEKTKRVLAIHAGWRGVKNGIVKKAVDYLLDSGSIRSELFAAIGPHIGPNSFEIENTFGNEILAADPTGHTQAKPHEDKNKMYVSLSSIVEQQIGNIPNILKTQEDTFTNLDYFSHRREPGKNRLISFIIRR